jgi:hypothetical protein
LQRLRRELEDTARNCRAGDATCEDQASRAGRSLAELNRQGRAAEARRRLAESVRQLLDRVRRGGATAADHEQLRRFARAAGGPGADRGDPLAAPTAPEGAAPDVTFADRSGSGAGNGPGESTGNGKDPAGRPGDEASGVTANANGDRASLPGGESADQGRAGAAPGSGVGSEPGGRVLGARDRGSDGRSGRLAAADVADDRTGPSRAEVIGGAGARGFASAAYRRVFHEYQTAVEESLDATAVPPGRRYLVRRYFQLIRPRTP